jgi:hypothetical protein
MVAVAAQAQSTSPLGELAPETLAAIRAASFSILGWLWQWARSPQRVSNRLTWGVFVLGATGLFVWQAGPGLIKTNPYLLGLGAYEFIMAARGFAATSKDVKIAPATDSK